MTTNDPFTAWQNALDGLCNRSLALGLADLPDYPLREWFDDGCSPAEAFEAIQRDFYDDLTDYYTFSDADPGL